MNKDKVKSEIFLRTFLWILSSIITYFMISLGIGFNIFEWNSAQILVWQLMAIAVVFIDH